jgi:hypothetical protein
MPLYDDPEDPAFARLEERFRWFPAVLEAEYGERTAPEGAAGVPAALDWMTSLAPEVRYSFDEVECSLAFEDPAAGYACTIWDVSGEDDLPWAVYLVDDHGARLLPEYSVLDNDVGDETLNAALQRAAEQLPDRLASGEFTRTEGTAPAVPDWLRVAVSEDDEENEDE